MLITIGQLTGHSYILMQIEMLHNWDPGKGDTCEAHCDQCHVSLTFMFSINTLRLRQNGRHFPDDIFKCIFLNEKICITIKNLLKFVPQGTMNNIPVLVQVMASRQPGDEPICEPMMVSLLTHICVTQPQTMRETICEMSQYVVTLIYEK